MLPTTKLTRVRITPTVAHFWLLLLVSSFKQFVNGPLITSLPFNNFFFRFFYFSVHFSNHNQSIKQTNNFQNYHDLPKASKSKDPQSASQDLFLVFRSTTKATLQCMRRFDTLGTPSSPEPHQFRGNEFQKPTHTHSAVNRSISRLFCQNDHRTCCCKLRCSFF